MKFLFAALAALGRLLRYIGSNERGSVTVDQWWVHAFHNQFSVTYQQMDDPVMQFLDPGMIHRNVQGGVDYHERLGIVVANDIVSPFGQTKILNPGHSRRQVVLQSSDAACLVSDEHSLRSMIEPQNGYMRLITGAMKRREVKHIIDAAIGTSTTAAITAGTGGITTGTQAMLAAHQIGGATAMDLARIHNASELLSKASVPNDGRRVMLYSPGQLRDILAITQASSSDFTKNRLHDKGTINGEFWEGYNWLEIPDTVDEATATLQQMLALSGTTRSCIALHGSALGLSVGREISPPSINLRADLNESIQVRTKMMMKATRVWEGGVVQVDALEN